MEGLINKKAWIIIINKENYYKLKPVTIKKVYFDKDREPSRYGVKYKIREKNIKINILSREVYFDKEQATLEANRLNGESLWIR